jgi:hypothetical protein
MPIAREIGVHWTEYTWRLADALAWPVLAVVIVFLFRTQLAGVAGRLEEFSIGRAKVKFGKGLEDAHKASENLPVKGDNNPVPEIAADKEFLDLARDHPEAAVLEAYKRIERFLVKTAGQYRDLRTKNPLTLAQQLYDDGFVDAGVVTLVENVRALRNTAIHANVRSIASNEAIAYRCLCDEVIHKLEDGLAKAKLSRAGENSGSLRAAG